ncbi:MAG TPA: leucine-rich repeat domain-containing protein [Archangium sp.]|nr:leucine-rich repeat domain-containing protein [Archangium sp.]
MKEQIQSWIWNFRRANRVDKAFLLSSLLLALPSFLKGSFLGNAEWLQGFPSVQAALQTGVTRVAPFAPALGGLCLGYASYKIWFWRPPLPAPPPPPPDAIKGGTSFGPQDGDLFLRLGRNDELGKLCGWVRDPTIPAAHKEHHAPIFDFLVRLLQRPGPSALTCVLAFRESYASEWMNFMVQRIDDARLSRPREMILERFRLDAHPGRGAADVLATLAHSAKLNVSAVEKPLLAALADSRGRVLPFDLAIALQYLHGLGRETLEASDVPPAGLDSIFVNHLRTTLGQVSEAERSELFAAIFFGLVEGVEQGGRRVADGRTVEELSAGRSLPPAHLKYALNTLAERSVGVLERLPGERYRLVHERFIRALRELAGVMLADADRARVTLRRASAAYEPARPWLRLLRGADLRAVERHWDRLHSDAAADGSDVLYRRSLLLRRWVRTGIAVTCILALGAGIRLRQWAEDEAWRNRLTSWGLPRNLYDMQWKLDRLTIKNSKMDDAGWIKAPLKELALHAPRLRVLPPGHTYTKLDLSGCGLTSLAGLEKLPALTSLDLSDNSLTSLAGLEKLPALTSLDLNGNSLTSLDGLEKLPAFTSLDLSHNSLTSLAGLETLKSLRAVEIGNNPLTTLDGLEKATFLERSSTLPLRRGVDASDEEPLRLELTNYTAELTPWPSWIRALTFSD